MDKQPITNTPFSGIELVARNLTPLDELFAKRQQLNEEIEKKRLEEEKKQKFQEAKERDADLKRLEFLNDKLAEINECIGLAAKLSLDDAKTLAREKTNYEQEQTGLRVKLGFQQPVSSIQTKKTFGLSSSNALWAIGALMLLSFLIFWAMGTAAVAEDPYNDSARRMMNSVGLRVLTNYLPFSMAILTAIGFLWLLLPSIFAYWHSKVNTNFSLITDLEQCEPSHRVAFFAFAFALPIWMFVQLMQVIFG